MKREVELVSASEVASWAWCPESWRLDSLGEEPSNIEALRRGEARHRGAAEAERSSNSALLLGVWLLVVSTLLAVVLFSLGVLP
jgi:hypothetical protein